MSAAAHGDWDDPRIAKGMRAQLELRRTLFEGGASQIGWKVGFGAPAAKQKLGIKMPLVGFLLDRALLPSHAIASVAGWQKPAAEAEIAVYLGEDLPPGADREHAKAAVASLGPAIELADIDKPMEDVEAVLAGDIFNRHVLLGPRDETRKGVNLAGLTGRVTFGDKIIEAPADLQTNIGDIVDIVRHVADVAARIGDRLRAGQFIITGAVVPPFYLTPDDRNVSFTLEPVGSVAADFRW